MKILSVAICLFMINIASNLIAAVNESQVSSKTTYGQKGMIELYGSLSLNGHSDTISTVNFSAEPGLNYFLANNIYMGARLVIAISRHLMMKKYYGFTYDEYYKTSADLGLGVPVGFIFKVKDHVYFNLEAPDLELLLIDLKYFRLYPNLITAFKFPFDNAVIDIGVRHRFFHITDGGVSGLYYSYRVFFGFSVCFDTVKREVKS